MPRGQDTPRVAVVVIGRNEGERLLRCLDSVAAADYPAESLEVIYVDSDSTDDSVASARRRGVNVLQVSPERPCAAVGRNAGWRSTDAEFVLFLDGDTILHPDFLRRSLEEFHVDEVAVVFGHRREIDTSASIYNRVLDLDWIFPLGELDFCGGDALMRRGVLVEVDGYDDTIIAGEEPEMCARMRALGHTVLHIDTPMTGHDLDMHRFSQYWRRGVRTGHAYAEVSERFRDTEEALWVSRSRRTLAHAGLMVATPVVCGTASLATRSLWPILGGAAFWTAVVARTIGRARWKSPDLKTRLMYAIHSHFQKIPIAAGQLSYLMDRRRGRRSGLIEYK